MEQTEREPVGGGGHFPRPIDGVLAVYGTLKPGRCNHRVVSMIEGRWLTGWIHGWLGVKTWGSYRGYPAFRLDPEGEAVPVAVLVSPELRVHWNRLDRFEGPEYRRVDVAVRLDVAGSVGVPASGCRAFVYEVLDAEEIDGR